MNTLLNKILQIDWCVDEEGDLTIRFWRKWGLTHYKWQEGAIFVNASQYRKIKKRGVTAVVEENA